MAEKNKKKGKWVKKRHDIFIKFIYLPVYIYLLIKYKAKIKIDKFVGKGKRPYLILYNHQTPCDQFFISMIFGGAVYYVATEDIFSAGFASVLLRHFLAPIPIKKSVSDVRAVMNCVKVAREGGTIAIAPEGNRTYSGRTCNMKKSIASLAKTIKLPIAFVRIEGGYGAEPRWSNVIRRGKIRVRVSDVLEYDDYKSLSDGELFDIIKNRLYVDENNSDNSYESKKRAEHLERLVYICPTCGISEFESKGNFVTCRSCGKRVEYLPTKKLRGDGFDLPFEYIGDWYDYQENHMNSLDLTPFSEKALFSDNVLWQEVIVYKNKKKLASDAKISAFGDRFEIFAGGDTHTFSFSDVRAVAICGRNKLQIYHTDKMYQFKGKKSFNAVKYMHVFYHAKNITEESDDKFLGL